MNEILLLLGMFAVTFGVRYPILSFVSRIKLPKIVTQGLTYVPPTVLTAIIVPAVLIPEGNGLALDISNAPFFASIIAILVAWRTKSALWTISIGMGAFWLLTWLL